MCKSSYYKNIDTVIEASSTNANLSQATIYNALEEVMKIFKIVRNAVVKHEMTNEQRWLTWETEMSELTTEDPNKLSEI